MSALRKPTIIVVIFALFMSLTLTACQPNNEQTKVMDLINQSRAEYGIAPVGDNYDARVKAQAWAEKLASEGELYHSNLHDGMEAQSYDLLFEIAGRNTSIEKVHDSYMFSPKHRAVVLDPRLQWIGTGVAWKDGKYPYTVAVMFRSR